MGQLAIGELEEDVSAALEESTWAHVRSAEAEHRKLTRNVLLFSGHAQEAREDWFGRARTLRGEACKV